MKTFLEFEKPIAALESKVAELRQLSQHQDQDVLNAEIEQLENKIAQLLQRVYANLLPVQKVQISRHPQRPHALDYIRALVEDFTPLSGDRLFGEDVALIAGLGRFRGYSVMILGQEKGNTTESRLHHNFGMPRPEGYRKARRMMLLAQRFKLPLIALVDTPGAYPGVGAEQRGQAEAIASCIETALKIEVPCIAVGIGEGGSGGAVALAVADRVLMLEHSIYSVISPEGCAAILWRNPAMTNEAATALRLTAQDLQGFNIIDCIVDEPIGGAHRNPEVMINRLGDHIESYLRELCKEDGATLRRRRREKFLAMGRLS